MALCHLCGPEAEPRGECYSCANDRAQAGKIFAEAEASVLAHPLLVLAGYREGSQLIVIVVADHHTYGGGHLSLVSEVFVVTTWQVLSMQYSVTPSWKIVQRLKFHPD